MDDRLERFIKLIAKTGDKLLVYDRHHPDDSFVLLGIDEYEKLSSQAHGVKDLTEDELIDRINRDITIWKADRVTPAPRTHNFAKKSKGNAWTIPESRRHEADEHNSEGNDFLEENPF